MLGSHHIPSWGEHGLPVTALLLSSASDLHVWYPRGGICVSGTAFSYLGLPGSPWVTLGPCRFPES